MAKHRDADSRPASPPSIVGPSAPVSANADLARLAWEFLRRNLDYRRDFERVRDGVLDALPDRWGLARAVDPDETAIAAATTWREAPPG